VGNFKTHQLQLATENHSVLNPAFSVIRLINVFSVPLSSQLLHLFNQLKQEILQSHIMEKSFVLIQELLTAAEKSFNLKKYFWKVKKKTQQQ